MANISETQGVIRIENEEIENKLIAFFNQTTGKFPYGFEIMEDFGNHYHEFIGAGRWSFLNTLEDLKNALFDPFENNKLSQEIEELKAYMKQKPIKLEFTYVDWEEGCFDAIADEIVEIKLYVNDKNEVQQETNILQQDEIEANHQNLEEYDLGITNSVM